MKESPQNHSPHQPGDDSPDSDRPSISRTRRLRKPEAEETKPSGPIAAEKPFPDEKASRQVRAQSEAADSEKKGLPSLKTEFSMRIGSLVEARRSMIKGYLMMILGPTVLLLTVISLLSGPNVEGAGGLIRSMEYMLTIVAAMALPFIVVFWTVGLYPRGSYGRFASGLAFASLLVVWLVFLLFESNLEAAFAESGVALELNGVLFLACLIAAFAYGQAVSELVDNRRMWKKSMGADVRIVALNLKSRFLDFDPRIGKFAEGNSSAAGAYFRLLVVPMLLLVLADWLIEEMDLSAKDQIAASVGAMFDTVLLFGIVLVIIHFVRGFYPSGSLGHLVAGIVRIPILFLFAWEILLGSGIEEELALNYFIVDMTDVMLPVLMYIAFITVFELSELGDGRRSWHKEIGMPVRAYVPEEHYGVLDDFRLRYVTFAAGAKKGVKVLSKYAFRRILIFTILGAIVVSIFEYAGSAAQYPVAREVIDHVESDFVGWLDHLIHTLLIIAVLLTSAYFFAWSYRAGSFSRLVMTWLVSLLSATWAYFLWGTAARSTNVPNLTLIFTIVMLAFIALACGMAFMAARVYSEERKEYLGWRSYMLDSEALYAKRQLPEGIPVPIATSPRPSPFEVPGFSAEPRRTAFLAKGISEHANILSASSYSFEVTLPDHDDLQASQEPPTRFTLQEDAAILTSTRSRDGSPKGPMASYMAFTKMPASKVLRRATDHFGALSGGLMVKSMTDSSVGLECPAGFVTIKVLPSKSGGKKNEVSIQTSQFDKQAKEFLARL